MLHCHIKQIKYKYKYIVIQLQHGKKRRWQNGVDFWQTVPFLSCCKQTPLVWKFVLMSAPNRLLLSRQQTPSAYFFRAYQEVLGGVLLYTLINFFPSGGSQMMFTVLTLRINVGGKNTYVAGKLGWPKDLALDRKMRIHIYVIHYVYYVY